MSGLLNKLITNGSVQKVATVPTIQFGSMNVRVVNPTNADQPIKLWLSADATAPSQADLIEHRAVVPANGGRYMDTGLIVSASETLYIQAAADLVVRAELVEEV